MRADMTHVMSSKIVRFTAFALALALPASSFAVVRPRQAAAQGPDLRFSDVPRDHWAVDYIRRTVNAGLLQGYEGRFLGNSPVNRYQMAQILSRIMDRMGALASAGTGGGGGEGPSSEIFLQIADEVANLNVAQSSLEEKVVQLRYDVEALKRGEVSGRDEGRGGPRTPKISPEEWDDRVRTQVPGALAALAVFASASLLKGAH